MHFTVGADRIYAYTGARAFLPGSPTIVFVHGAANDHSVWALQSRYFAHHGWNVVAMDLPGHGRSDGVPPPTVQALADWLAAMLDALGLPDAVIVGHSLGSLVVLDFAARHAARARAIALLGPSVPMPVADVLLAAALANDHVAIELIAGWSHTAASQLGGNPVPGMWMMGGATCLLERSAPGVLHNDLLACNAYADGLQAAAAVRCPALVIIGARDVMAPPRAARSLTQALTGVQVVTLPDTGHAMMAERPDAVLDALRAFVATLPDVVHA